MSGYLSIEKKNAPWTRPAVEAYAANAAVGILAGIAVTFAHTPLHLPGHKVVFWMAPVLATRLLTRSRAGASTGACSTAVTTFLLGGRLAGGAAMMPLVILAGAILDIAAANLDRRNAPIFRKILLLALAGAAGNLICFVKRLFDGTGGLFASSNPSDLLIAAIYYAFFGFIAAALGCGAAIGLKRAISRNI